MLGFYLTLLPMYIIQARQKVEQKIANESIG